MPFVVYDGTRRVSALDYLHPTAWREFRDDTELVELLRFACCGAAAVPKTSPYGLPFFAHAPGRACEASGKGGQESFRHQLLKAAAQSLCPEADPDLPEPEWREVFRRGQPSMQPSGRPSAQREALAAIDAEAAADTRPAEDPARIRDRYARLNAAARIISGQG